MATDIDLRFKPLQVSGLIETAKILQATDKRLLTALRKELREGIQPISNKVQHSLPPVAPLSGMIHNGRSRWDLITAKVSFQPSKQLGKGRQQQPLISLIVTGKKGLGFDYAELAGINRRKPKAKSRAWTDQWGNEQAADGLGYAVFIVQ